MPTQSIILKQTAEKSVKAILILEKLFVRDHIVSDFFVDVMNKFKQRKGLLDILKDIKDLEKHWVRPRYPFITKHIIWNPLKGYTKKMPKKPSRRREGY